MKIIVSTNPQRERRRLITSTVKQLTETVNAVAGTPLVTKQEVRAAFRAFRAFRKANTAALLALGLLTGTAASAQVDGNTGISQATSMVASYFDTGITLMYAVGGVLGLIGALRVYQKWSHGDHDTSKVAAAWFGSCIFLVVVATLIKSFFGLQ